MSKKNIVRLLALLVLGLIIWLIYFTGIAEYLTFESIKNNRSCLEQLVKKNYMMSVIIFMASSAALMVTFMPSAVLSALIGGFLFGAPLGMIYTNISVMLGGLGIFFISRFLLRGFIQKKYGERLKNFNEAFVADGPSFILTLHFLSIIPFSIIGTLAGLTNIKWTTFAWTAVVGFLPMASICAFAGQQLGDLSSIKDIFSYKMIILFLLLALLALLPIVIKKVKKYANV